MTTNGHPTTPPIEAPLPKPVTLERKLEVNVYDGNYCQESVEPTINDVQGWCFEHGHVAIGLDDPKLAGALSETTERFDPLERKLYVKRGSSFIVCELPDSNPANEPARDTERPPVAVTTPEQYEGLTGEPPPKNLFAPPLVFSVNAGRSCGAHGGAIDPNCRDCYTSSGPHQAPGEVTRIKRPEKKSLRQAVEARVGGQFHSIGDAAMAKLNALIEVLEERLP